MYRIESTLKVLWTCGLQNLNQHFLNNNLDLSYVIGFFHTKPQNLLVEVTTTGWASCTSRGFRETKNRKYSRNTSRRTLSGTSLKKAHNESYFQLSKLIHISLLCSFIFVGLVRLPKMKLTIHHLGTDEFFCPSSQGLPSIITAWISANRLPLPHVFNTILIPELFLSFTALGIGRKWYYWKSMFAFSTRSWSFRGFRYIFNNVCSNS